MSETLETDDGFLSALHKGDRWQFFGNKRPRCPHCSAEFDISRSDRWDLYDDNDRHEVTCGSCDRPYLVSTHCSYTFSTDEQDDLDEPTPPTKGTTP